LILHAFKKTGDVKSFFLQNLSGFKVLENSTQNSFAFKFLDFLLYYLTIKSVVFYNAEILFSCNQKCGHVLILDLIKPESDSITVLIYWHMEMDNVFCPRFLYGPDMQDTVNFEL